MGNVHGRMTGLTLFTPIRPQWVWFLRVGLPLTRHLPFMARHILQFNFIKFVRWTIVPGLDGERLNYPYLFFESNFDGPWQHYIDAFAYVIPLDIRVTWGRGPGFPAPPPAEPLKAWIADEQHGGRHVLLRARRRVDADGQQRAGRARALRAELDPDAAAESSRPRGSGS